MKECHFLPPKNKSHDGEIFQCGKLEFLLEIFWRDTCQTVKPSEGNTNFSKNLKKRLESRKTLYSFLRVSLIRLDRSNVNKKMRETWKTHPKVGWLRGNCVYIYIHIISIFIYIYMIFVSWYLYIYVCIDIYTCISYISTFLLESFNSCCAGYTTFDYTAGFLWPERIVRCLPLHHQMLVYLAWLVCRECLAAKRGIIYHDTWFIDLDLAYPKTPQKWCQRKSQTFFLEEKLPKRPETIPKELGIKISSELRPPPLETNENEIIVPGDIVRATQKKTMASWVQANGRDTHTHSHFLVFFFSNSELLHRGFWLERMFFVFSFCYTDRFPHKTTWDRNLLGLQISSPKLFQLGDFFFHTSFGLAFANKRVA